MSKLPNKIKCTCCGESKGVREPVLNKRIERFGSLEKLLAEYVCRNCMREVKDRVDVATSPNIRVSKKKNSKTMERYLKGELWFQQPDYVFPRVKIQVPVKNKG
jgi:hypothetical protein